MTLNKAIIIGRLTHDPEIRSLPSGKTVTSFSVATNRVWTEGNETHQKTEYHKVVMFGEKKYPIEKGTLVLVEGHLQTRSWEKDGQKKFKTEIVVENLQFDNS